MPALDNQQNLTPDEYILRNFQASDRLAVVIINRQEGKVQQRVETAEVIAGEKYQAWLRHENARGSDIYLSQNALRETATGRTKAEIAAIRHVYLDLDHEGPQALAAIEASSAVPKPSYVIAGSPGKYQVIWRVEGMTQDQAEALQRSMVQQFGADPAATDSARVLRLPGFINKKYEQPFRVTAEQRSTEIYHAGDFTLSPEHRPARDRTPKTTSEHDWSWVKKRLERGEPVELLIEKLIEYRDDKPNPGYYARRTVTRAYAQAAPSRGDDPQQVVRAISAHPPRPYENGEQYARTVVDETLAKLARSNGQDAATNRSARQQSQQLALGVNP